MAIGELGDALALRTRRARGFAFVLAIFVPAGLLLASIASWITPEAGIGAGIVAMTLFLVVLVDGLNRFEDDRRRREESLSAAVAALTASTQAALNASEQANRILVRREIADHPWTDLFESSSNVTIVAKFFDYPLSGARSEAVERFFRSGGTFAVVTIDPRCKEAIDSMYGVLGVGRGVKRRNLLERSAESVETLEQLRVQAGAAESAIEVFPFAGVLTWAAYCFDDRHLIFTPYELYLDDARRSPRLEVELDTSPDFLRFWEGQWAALTQGRVTGSEPEALSAQEYIALYEQPAEFSVPESAT